MNTGIHGVPIGVGTMINAWVTENATLIAGATENPTAMVHLFLTSVQLTNLKTEGGPVAAGPL